MDKQPKKVKPRVYDFTGIANGEYSVIIEDGEIKSWIDDEDIAPLIGLA
jgi:hypothetical protein